MGVLRRIRRRPGGGRRLAAVTGAVLVTAGGAVACQPGDLSSASVAYTTDQTATRQLERQHVKVRWLSCVGDYGSRSPASHRTPAPSASTVVTVDCQGQTDDKRDITVTGRVTRAVDGKCVRGNLTATVGGRRWFHVSGLGDCNAAATPIPPVTFRPTAPGQPGPTVTVTRTIWCQGDPTCWPVRGK
ncbi:hypothetical protein MBT84_28480 [Streptomyces sp. MBT84]|jgi:hypothetical protein|uniref:hypothetical protein n=1 Tax=unclassified Streptomyces TaxID=2593676 RepID=UPI000E3A01F6|nr:hypothetical protein [Streptomyces sp. MI02-2A]MBW8703537.1 hypothetical protein [Streptomyces sp. MBT84]MDX3257996.1 hypothetical protein [Streptomyces sp. MI02-2A]REE60648.1 hypothetical protein BX257_3191 [Streptomyces sp. 3212.3]